MPYIPAITVTPQSSAYLIDISRSRWIMSFQKVRKIMKGTDDCIRKLRVLCTLRENEPMRNYTSFHSGGPAEILITPKECRFIPEILGIIESSGRRCTVIGGGTNLLVSDRGIEGVVLMIREDDAAPARLCIADGIVYADASVTKERFIGFALEHGFCGMEFMAGIPGCMGGGIIMNAGTYMGWFGDILKSVDIAEPNGGVRTIGVTPEMSCYRKLDIPAGAVVIGGRFALKEASDIDEPGRIVAGVLEDRRKKHPLQFPSAGSVFKNPEGHSSWKLIDDSGLKGFRIGGARVSELHTNFIINEKNATSSDIYELIRHVQRTVSEKAGIQLETEVRMIGAFS